MSVAAATGRVGYVFFVGGKLMYWGVSEKASKSTELARTVLDKWIRKLEPQVIITERVGTRTRKGSNSVEIIDAIAKAANDAPLNDIQVPRIQQFNNKYEEANAIAERFPTLAYLLPSRPPRLWESEPRQMIYFEAMALAIGVVTNHELGGTKPLFPKQ